MTYESRQPPHPPEVPRKAPDEPPGWFDKPKNIRLLKLLAYASVLVMFALDFVLHYHLYTGWEQLPGFYTLFGLVASFVLIGIAKIGGKPLKREEDYYE